jgi:hypothetical protein
MYHCICIYRCGIGNGKSDTNFGNKSAVRKRKHSCEKLNCVLLFIIWSTSGKVYTCAFILVLKTVQYIFSSIFLTKMEVLRMEGKDIYL